MTAPGPPGSTTGRPPLPRAPADPAAGANGQPGPTPYRGTPNAERYLLEADNLRRRQLRSALLHGSTRTWRERRRVWPAVIGGIVVTAVIVAAIAVYGAFQRQQAINEERERERQPRPTATAAAPAPGVTPPAPTAPAG